MKTIAHFTSVDQNAAGALPFEIHRFLKEQGWRSFVVTSVPGKSVADVLRLHRTRFTKRIAGYFRSIGWYLRGELARGTSANPAYRFNPYTAHRYYSPRRLMRGLPKRLDVIMVHFHDSLLDAMTVADMAARSGALVVWLMMDMAVFTGGCHYAMHCDRYTRQCGTCPALGSSTPGDRSSISHSAKQTAFTRMRSIAVAGSSWQQSQAIDSSILEGQRIEKLLFPVDETVFHPGDQARIRTKLNIPRQNKVIFFGASFIDEPRKGFADFVAAMEILLARLSMYDDSPPLTILIAGRYSNETLRVQGADVRYLGLLDANQLAEVYQATDVFLCPTLEDSGPLMINQALMSGVPVIAYATGVARDIVINGETGYSVDPGDIEALAHHTEKLLRYSTEEYQHLSKSCRALAESSWTRDAFHNALLRLISS